VLLPLAGEGKARGLSPARSVDPTGDDPRPGGRGAVTAEWALTLPAVGITLAVVVGGIGLAIDHGRLVHAAGDSQRVMSYGGDHQQITQHAHSVLGSTDTVITLSSGSDDYTGCVTISRQSGHWLAGLLGISAEATSCGLVPPR
jgi:hypothetical protein